MLIMEADWTEKYRPKSLSDLLGNSKAITQLAAWANQWDIGTPPKKKAVILVGDPGIGKTSSALALASDMGWVPVEMNASDMRNSASVKNIATRGAIYDTFTSEGDYFSSKEGMRKLIIMGPPAL